MAVGFRKSLLGFNCDDVMRYIEKTHKTFVEKEKDLEDQVSKLSQDLDLSKEELEKLNNEKEIISKKLNTFTEKYEEIERLSENIGKLYLVAQANAQAIMSNSEKNAELAGMEIQKNLYSIDQAHASLDELRDNIVKTSNDFVNEVDTLINSLTETRERITENIEENSQHKNQFNELYNSIVK